MSNKKIISKKIREELESKLFRQLLSYEPDHVLNQAQEELGKLKDKKGASPDTFLYKSMTLLEFDKGLLLCTSVPERFSTFALDFSMKLQKEFDCDTSSKKSLAEIVSLNFVRIIWIQDNIRAYLDKGSITDIGVKYLDFLSRELDRAQRHYQAS